jgi:hypothetical protein
VFKLALFLHPHLNVAGAAQFRPWTEIEETIILNLCLKPVQSNSNNFQDINKTMIEENAKIKQPIRKGAENQNYFRTQREQFELI